MKKLLVKATIGIAVIVFVGDGAAYLLFGKTPAELLDYAEVALKDHAEMEVLAKPIVNAVRQETDLPALADRLQQPMQVPMPKPTAPDTKLLASLPAPQANVLRVGPGQQFPSIAEAAKQAKDGQIVEILAGNYYGDVALWTQRQLTIRAIGGRVRLYANGKSAEGKAIWVLRNGDFIVENIEFFDAKVADKNGAGIRAEAGSLSVKNCLFYGNQNGILTGNQLTLLEVQRSEFAYNGAGDGLSHGIYAGAIAEFRAYGNYFHHANRGHLIKSRAEKSIIAYNRLTDETDGRASYEIDLPNAGQAFIAFNLIQQSATGENSTLISFGAEGIGWKRNELWLEKNTLVNDNPWGGTFLRVAKDVSKVTAVNNLIIGRGGIQSAADNTITDNLDAVWGWFVMPQRLNYQLKALIPVVSRSYARPAGSPEPGYYLEVSNYQIDPQAAEFAGAMPVLRAKP